MSKPRSAARSSSRAHAECPVCRKRLSGVKGVVSHLGEAHAIGPEQAERQFGLRLSHR